MRGFDRQLILFPVADNGLRKYAKGITAAVNIKGVLDIDSVKGCSFGMKAYPGRGCYGDCYAVRIAAYRGFDFTASVCRNFSDREHLATIRRILAAHGETWYRVGTHGDPSFDWAHTLHVCKYLWPVGKTAVIITKHWQTLDWKQVEFLRKLGAVVNTSVSGMDTPDEIEHRLGQFWRLREAGIESILRVVTCDYGAGTWARDCAVKQDWLLEFQPIIDNPFRPSKSNPRVLAGEIRIQSRPESIGGRNVSLHSTEAYLGHCSTCLDQCGVNLTNGGECGKEADVTAVC